MHVRTLSRAAADNNLHMLSALRIPQAEGVRKNTDELIE